MWSPRLLHEFRMRKTDVVDQNYTVHEMISMLDAVKD